MKSINKTRFFITYKQHVPSALSVTVTSSAQLSADWIFWRENRFASVVQLTLTSVETKMSRYSSLPCHQIKNLQIYFAALNSSNIQITDLLVLI